MTASADGARFAAVSDRGFIYTTADSGETWVQRATDMERDWYSIASSSDGSKLVAAAGYDYIYTSIDYGVTWQPLESSGMRSWTAVVSSADGTKFAATTDSGVIDDELGDIGGYIYTFTVGDDEWVQQAMPNKWKSLASSADGTKLIAGTWQDGAYTYTEGDDEWIAIDQSAGSSISWWTAAVSADGESMAVAGDSGHIVVSENYGETWHDRTQPGEDWTSLAYADGGMLLIGVQDSTSYVQTSTDNALSWENIPVKDIGDWGVVLSSSDGNVVITLSETGGIYRSIDGGLTWTYNAPPTNEYSGGLSMSADGNKLFAVYSGTIYTSVNGGATWTEHTVPGDHLWGGGTISDDGTTLVATDAGEYLYTSVDGGDNWVARTSLGKHGWQNVQTSADGMTILAQTPYDSLYLSKDGGATWSSPPVGDSVGWFMIEVSANGETMMASNYDNQLYMSTDGGDTWNERETLNGYTLNALASSADGRKLTVAQLNEGVWTSADAGETWSQQEINSTTNQWVAVASSANGAKLYAIEYMGYLYQGSSLGEEETPPEEETPTPPVVTPPSTSPAPSQGSSSGTVKTNSSSTTTSSTAPAAEESTSQPTIDLMKESAFRAGDEYKVEVSSGQVLSFKVNDAPHTFTVDNVQNNMVTFTIRSTPQTHTLRVGETGKYDVDGDKADDISVTVNSVTNGVAQLTMTNLLATKVSVLSMPQDEAADASKSATKPSINYSLIAWIAGGVVALLIAILIIRKTKRA